MKKKLLAVALSVLLLLGALSVTALACDYQDIHSSWYTDAVIKYGDDDIFSGPNGKFNPNKKITRMEFVRLLHKALDISINYFAAPDIAGDFSDMENTDVGADALIDLVTAGIVEKGGSFEPNKQLDRDVMIHWIMNALVYKTNGTYPIPNVKPVPFKDDAKITDAYRSQVYSAVALKLVSGEKNSKLHPKQGATRAEAVTVVSRLVDLLGNSNTPVPRSVAVSATATETGGALVMTLTIKNNANKTVTIMHNNGQKYDFRLFSAKGVILYTWSFDKMFAQAVNYTVLNPGQSVSYTETIDKYTYAVIKPGVYSMKAYIVGTSGDFTINTNGYPGLMS